MIFCPFCDGQGLIYKAKLKASTKWIYICDECDLIWHNKNITEENCDNFDEYMEALGRKGLWEEFETFERL